MRIAQSQVALASSRVASVSDTARSKLEAWIGDRPAKETAAATATTSSSSGPSAAGAPAIARLSAQARAAARSTSQLAMLAQAGPAAGSSRSAGMSDPTDPTTTDPNLRVLIMLIERLTGHKIKLVHLDVPADAQAAAQQAGDLAAAQIAAAQGAPAQSQQAGWGVELQVEQVHRETETTGFTAAGQVVTSDGQTINFDYRLAMHRDFTASSGIDLQFGDAVKKIDPIALNLTGGAAELSSDRSAFDIDSDGKAEQVALPAAGTYFLALDRNGNGTIDSGSELFGPSSGNGFTELKSLDGDGNGWIDQGDSAYGNLKLWAGSGELTPLDQAGVGALFVGRSVSTQFDIRGRADEALGQVVSSSVYVGDNGTPGALQQVDLTA